MTTRSIQVTVAALGERIPAPVILIIALVLLQAGSGFAKQIMSAENVMGLLFLRLTLGGLFLTLIIRPRVSILNRSQWIDIFSLSLALTTINVTMYWALVHLPLGLVATIGFLGPLSVSLIGAKKLLDFFWPLLAFCGVFLLAPVGDTAMVSWSAIGYGLAFACAWAFYILASAKTGRTVSGLDGLIVATYIAAIMILPFAYVNIDYFFSTPALIKLTIIIALFATLPFGLEFIALKRLPPRTFGILLSLEPAIASITGIILLKEQLSLVTWLAIAVVSAAAIGVSLTQHVGMEKEKL